MKNFLFNLVLCSLILSFGNCSKDEQPETGVDLPEKTFYPNEEYGSNRNWLGQTEKLLLDVYLPQNAPGGSKNFPFIMFVHGGGFLGGDKAGAASFAQSLTAKGFVVASINYRLGWDNDKNDKCKGDTMSAKEAMYRALQDTRAAFRYITAHAARFAIDTSKMFQAGSSAGGLTSILLNVINEQNATTVFPGFEAKLGPINSSNDLKNKFTIKGLIDMWGAIYNTNLFTKENAVPTIIFHGMLDQVCPYDVSHFYSCASFPVSYGGKPIYERLVSLGVPVVANIDPKGGHGVYDESFITTNIACFLNALISGKPQTGFYTDGSGNCK